MYTISDISKMFSLPTSTIRYYEKIGLLENVEYINGYHRSYNESHVERLKAIECFKNALLPLDEIKMFFSYEKDIYSNSTKIVDMMKLQEQKTLEAMENLEKGLEHIQHKVAYYSAVDSAIKSNSPVPTWNDVIKD